MKMPMAVLSSLLFTYQVKTIAFKNSEKLIIAVKNPLF